MKCTSMFKKHSWAGWVTFKGSPRKLGGHDGLWRQECQRRTCTTCGYSQHEWLPTWQPHTESIETADDSCENDITRRILEDLTDRACKNETIKDVPRGLSEFTDWLRSLYPELYTSSTDDKKDN